MARNAASLALRLRSPRDRPLLPCSIDVLLVCWDTKPVITPGGRLGLNRYEVLLGIRTSPTAGPGAGTGGVCEDWKRRARAPMPPADARAIRPTTMDDQPREALEDPAPRMRGILKRSEERRVGK